MSILWDLFEIAVNFFQGFIMTFLLMLTLETRIIENS